MAEQYGVPLINFNIEQDRYDLNYATDMGDDQHMNTLGSTKYSAYIAGYLMDNYDLADRRGDDYYSSWDKTLEVWERTHKVAQSERRRALPEIAQKPRLPRGFFLRCAH